MCVQTFGQEIIINIEPDNALPVCPGEEITYTADIVGASPACVYKWTVTNGVFAIDGGTSWEGGNMVTVIWDNQTSGSLKVETNSCSSSDYDGLTKTLTYKILCLKYEAPDYINGSDEVPFTSYSQNYACPTLYYPGINPPESVHSYRWLIPAGWAYPGGPVSDGTTPVSGLSRSITVYPDETSGGVVKVWGYSDCGDGYYSQPTTLSVTRVFPDNVGVSSTTSNTFIQGDTSPITLSVPDWSFAQYQWAKPATWQWQGSSTGSTVTVRRYLSSKA